MTFPAVAAIFLSACFASYFIGLVVAREDSKIDQDTLRDRIDLLISENLRLSSALEKARRNDSPKDEKTGKFVKKPGAKEK
jgi:hypothetical protein